MKINEEWEWNPGKIDWSPDYESTTSTWYYNVGPPKFCEACGQRLNEDDRREVRYDKYTGKAYKIGVMMLTCPDWSLNDKEGQRHTRESYDPSRDRIWVTYTDSNTG